MDRDFGVGKYLGIWVFGITFGYLEAAVVVYLRHVFALDSGPLFPVASVLGEDDSLIATMEANREAATLILILIPAYFSSRRTVYRMLTYALLFAVWDLSYYGFLWSLIGWPASFFTYDILFLIPTLWVSPVLCPMLIALSLIFYASGMMVLARHRAMTMLSPIHGLFLLAGAGLMLYALTAEAEYFLAGGLPPRFPWQEFLLGYALGMTGGLHYMYLTARQPKSRYR